MRQSQKGCSDKFTDCHDVGGAAVGKKEEVFPGLVWGIDRGADQLILCERAAPGESGDDPARSVELTLSIEKLGTHTGSDFCHRSPV